MITKEVAESVGGLKLLTPTGTSVLIEGELAATPEGTKQVGVQRGCGAGSMKGFRKTDPGRGTQLVRHWLVCIDNAEVHSGNCNLGSASQLVSACPDHALVRIWSSISPQMIYHYCLLVQAVELKATKVVHVGECDAATYPIAKKKVGMFLVAGSYQ
jgi:hypothetical protein